MKVLFLTHSFPREPGDAPGSFVLRLATRARESEGVEMRVVAPGAAGARDSRDARRTSPSNGSAMRRASTRRSPTAATWPRRSRHSWGARVTMLGFLGAEFRSAVQARREFEPDVVHAHWWFPNGLVGTWLARMSHKPLVTTLHGTDVRLARTVAFSRPAFRHVHAALGRRHGRVALACRTKRSRSCPRRRRSSRRCPSRRSSSRLAASVMRTACCSSGA